MEDSGGKHCCRWIDCSALYDQQEELVRHIEKVHIDQRKGEDFTCFWTGCPRRYKPFNARYKLLIHMRVHSGEKPNKCTVRYFARVSGVHDFESDRESISLECEARVVSELQGFPFTFIQPQFPEWHGPRGPS